MCQVEGDGRRGARSSARHVYSGGCGGSGGVSGGGGGDVIIKVFLPSSLSATTVDTEHKPRTRPSD